MDLATELDWLDMAEDVLTDLTAYALGSEHALAQRDPMLCKLIRLRVLRLRRDLDAALIQLLQHNEQEARQGKRLLLRWRSNGGQAVVLTLDHQLLHKHNPGGSYRVAKAPCTLAEARDYVSGLGGTYKLTGVTPIPGRTTAKAAD